MRSFLKKAKASSNDQSLLLDQAKPQQSPSPSEGQLSALAPPTVLDVLRYRYHHGTNVGSIFVVEKWLFSSMFPPSARGGSELDAVTQSIRTIGLAATRAKWQGHWARAVSDVDFHWLVHEAKCTSLRLPVGHFTLGKAFCADTPFEPVADVYVGAWDAVRDVVRRARAWGVGVLLDFHALPWGANRDAHSGSSSGRAEFWGNKKAMDLATRCILFVVREIRQGLDGVVGLQLVNEALRDAEGMYAWYEDVLAQVCAVDATLPVYVSDGWDLERALKWANGRRKGNPVVVDTHMYYTFSDADRSQSPQQIISKIPRALAELDGKEGSVSDRGAGQIVVGEYSCVLDGKTWAKVRPEEKDYFVKEFGQAQTRRWRQRAGGSYFWTLKMDWMDGGEWGFVEQTKKGNITPPLWLTIPKEEVRRRVSEAQTRRGELHEAALRSHIDYWNRTTQGKKFEHERYGQGWDIGFSDAECFFEMRTNGYLGTEARGGGDRIGCLDIWVQKRLRESGQRGEFAWEWEHGFRAGIAAFYGVVEI
jgi:aryl-phospho-beta-D-glucosidase BglC (GH1 family)